MSVIAACSLAAASAAAQGPVTVTGVVTDSSGRVLPESAIEARRGLRMVAAATAGPDGRYRLELHSAGPHRLTARLDGFAAGAAEVTATAGAAANVDFRLDIAPLRDAVVVTASRTAEAAASVTESHSVFTADDIAALGGRSVADVLRYVPGLNVESSRRAGRARSRRSSRAAASPTTTTC